MPSRVSLQSVGSEPRPRNRHLSGMMTPNDPTEEATKQAAEQDLAQGKAASTAAGEFVREEVHHVREGKHGAKNTKQAIAIGLSKARRAGIPARPSSSASSRTKRKAAQESERAGIRSRALAAPKRPFTWGSKVRPESRSGHGRRRRPGPKASASVGRWQRRLPSAQHRKPPQRRRSRTPLRPLVPDLRGLLERADLLLGRHVDLLAGQ